MEVHWNTHREWRRGVLVFRYRSKVCKKLKTLTPFCFALRHDVPVICHRPSGAQATRPTHANEMTGPRVFELNPGWQGRAAPT